MDKPKQIIDLRYLLKMGLLAGIIAGYTAVIGMITVFDNRQLIAGVLTLGQILLVAAPLGFGYFVAHKAKGDHSAGKIIGNGAIIGILASIPSMLIILIGANTGIRQMFVNISPDLIAILTFGQENIYVGMILLAVLMVVAGVLGSALRLVPDLYRRAIVMGLAWTLGVGLMSELIILIIRPLLGRGFIRIFFSNGSLKPFAALIIFFVAAGFYLLWQNKGDVVKDGYANLSKGQRTTVRRGGMGFGTIVLLLLPWILGTFLSEVIDNVGLYILMGLGLNIAVGLAGLLDLGYVTNFAVGAYITGILTSTGAFGTLEMSFWFVIPIAILSAMCTGFLFALPVLRMRGDYLAIATLGFGEIVRVLALSDWLAPIIGGPQGILDIPKPELFGFAFAKPEHLYYIILAACLLMLFVSLRLNNSRTGRKWMAVREDEDVAAAMGIDTTLSKLLAFTLSAASGGLAGAIFAAKLGTIFPQSFSLLVSINVLSIIIVGGMGSIPGIVLGALLLIGMPELLREFAEYRLLLYGALLIVVMLLRPEGLWPSAVRRRELHDAMDEGMDLGVPHSEVVSHGQTITNAPRMD